MPSSTSSLPLAFSLAAAVGAGIIVGALLLIVRRRDERDRGASPRNKGTRCQAKRSGGGGGGGGGSMYTVSGGAESARAARERYEARLQLRSDKSKAGKKAKKAIAKEARATARGKGTGKGTQLTELGGREGTEEGTEEGTGETAEMGSTHLLCSMCGVMQARATAFTPRQAKRKEASRKCRACVDAFPPSSSVSRYEKQGQSKH